MLHSITDSEGAPGAGESLPNDSDLNLNGTARDCALKGHATVGAGLAARPLESSHDPPPSVTTPPPLFQVSQHTPCGEASFCSNQVTTPATFSHDLWSLFKSSGTHTPPSLWHTPPAQTAAQPRPVVSDQIKRHNPQPLFKVSHDPYPTHSFQGQPAHTTA